ncbi:MAG: DUF5615 family PIN-like protein [Bacteroidia bacterium]
MKFLLDENLPRFFAESLVTLGIEAIHVSEVGLLGVKDELIISYAIENQFVIITFDLDFTRIVALSQRKKPSVISLRYEIMTKGIFLDAMSLIFPEREGVLNEGSLITISNDQLRIRMLPIVF